MYLRYYRGYVSKQIQVDYAVNCLLQPSIELKWIYLLPSYLEVSLIFIFFLLLQFIREYTGKVDELVKDKIEAQNEVKAKEQEEKDVVAQQVIILCHAVTLSAV